MMFLNVEGYDSEAILYYNIVLVALLFQIPCGGEICWSGCFSDGPNFPLCFVPLFQCSMVSLGLSFIYIIKMAENTEITADS